ncbi:hypothetical protein D9_0220 [Aeromonas phage D9]|nr:hypothetical protein D9_0220 [Aeromonas phage D9]
MITGLIIKDCIPLARKGITSIELDTREQWNILIARNGFGKTTLLRLMTPLPPDNADFGPNGYKEWRFVDDRGTFILKSKTGKNSTHEFIHNGTNLNEGKTLMVQRDLVKIHFGITQQIVDVLTGLDIRDLFTTMSAARRKDFLMTVNPNDTSYALKRWEKLKSNHNTLRGGLKTQRQRLVVEEGRLTQLAAMDADKLREEIANLDTQIKDALVLHGKLANVKHREIQPLKQEINDIISRLLGNDHRIKLTSGQYGQQLEDLTTRLDRLNLASSRLSGIHAELVQQLQGVDSGSQNLDGYKKRVEMIEQTLESLKSNIELIELFFTDHQFFMEGEFFRSEAVTTNGTELIEQLRLVHRARDENATSEKFKSVQEKLTHKKNELANIEADITQINHQLQHYQKAETVECPDCTKKFKLGFEKFNPQELVKIRDERVANKEVIQTQIRKYSDYVEANEDWYGTMASFMRYVRRLEHSDEILRLVSHYNVGKAETIVLQECLRRAVQLDKSVKQYASLEEEKQSLIRDINYLESSDVNALFLRAEEVEREMAITQRQIGRVRQDIKDTQEKIDIIIDDGYRRDRLSELMAQIQDVLEQNGLYRIKLRVKEAIDELSPQKEQMIGNLIRAESLNSVIQSIKDDIANLEKRERHTQLLLDGLSPVKGFIGYLMNDFLKSVIGNINVILQEVWTTRLRVLNCSTSKDEDSVDLNYQFPALTSSDNHPNKDISQCSGGERELINFAFRLVVLRYMGPKCGIPLMMDEVGVALDELHRGMFRAWMSEQNRTDALPKVFMISHDYAQFGATHANFIGLNTEGLKVPANVNARSVIR